MDVPPEQSKQAEKAEEAKQPEEAKSAHAKGYSYTFFEADSYFKLLLASGTYMSFQLLYPAYSPGFIFFQSFCINIWVYLLHRACHLLPNIPLNYHLYSHHNKQFHLSRPLELFCEFFTNFSWFLLILLLKYCFDLQLISTSLVLFLGLWYSSVHVVNLSLFPHMEHKLHHHDYTVNYGPPYIDYLFGTLQVEDGYTADYEIPNGIASFAIVYALRQMYQLD
jgi:hypothetical protein